MDLKRNRLVIYKSFDDYKTSGFSPTVCIIGSGPAGISLALQLEKQKIPSLVVEAGGYRWSAESQDIYRGNVIGDKYFDLDIARLRYLGGTSNHWGGWCRQLDEYDFEPKNGVKNTGWPIRKKDLDPYAESVNSILENEKIHPDSIINQNLKEIYFTFSPRVNFGTKYRKHIRGSSLIGLLINTSAKYLVPAKGKISHINLHSKDGAIRNISAKYFSLCTGGIENSRILLWSNMLHNGGVVPNAETLGKFWMEHPHFTAGDTVLFNFRNMSAKPNNRGIRFYSPTSGFLEKHNTGNFALRLHAGENNLHALIKDGICIAPKLFEPLAKKINSKFVCNAALRISWEQMPVSSNRIELSDAKDATGVPRVNLFWKKQAEDRRSIETAVKLFGRHLAEENIGRVKVIDWLANGSDYPDDDELAGNHHMGGTRMASTPTEGIVDANCKVFGVENLYIGGSSVFPTGGHANPTYTIIQLALRLGDHIAENENKKA